MSAIQIRVKMLATAVIELEDKLLFSDCSLVSLLLESNFLPKTIVSYSECT